MRTLAFCLGIGCSLIVAGNSLSAEEEDYLGRLRQAEFSRHPPYGELSDTTRPIWGALIALAEDAGRMPTVEEYAELLAESPESMSQIEFITLDAAFVGCQKPATDVPAMTALNDARQSTIDACEYEYEAEFVSGNSVTKKLVVTMGFDGPRGFIRLETYSGDGQPISLSISATDSVRFMRYRRKGTDCLEPITDRDRNHPAEIQAFRDFSAFFLRPGLLYNHFPDHLHTRFHYKYTPSLIGDSMSYCVYEEPVMFGDRKCFVAGSVVNHYFIDVDELLIVGRTSPYRFTDGRLKREVEPFKMQVESYMQTEHAGRIPSKYTITRPDGQVHVTVRRFKTGTVLEDNIIETIIPLHAPVWDTIADIRYFNGGPAKTRTDIPAEAANTQSSRSVLIAVNVVGIALVIVFILWRRLRTNSQE